MTEPASQRALCDALEELSHEPGYIYAFCWIIRHDLFLDPSEAADINWKARLSFQELTFLGGLLVKKPISLDMPSETGVASQIERTYELFEALHASFIDDLMRRMRQRLASGPVAPEDFEATTTELFGGSAMAEAIFYSSSGAYDFQYWDFAPTRYRHDSEWLIENVGVDIATAARMVRALKDRPDAFREGNPETFVERSKALLDSLCFRQDALSDFELASVASFLQAFSLDPGTANASLSTPGEYNELLSRPLIRLDSSRYFVPVMFNLSQSLYESPTHWMRTRSCLSRHSRKAPRRRDRGDRGATSE